ncbi:MAG: hypothetical protein ABJA98_35035, partial [Acidobacteriota bacterium]
SGRIARLGATTDFHHGLLTIVALVVMTLLASVPAPAREVFKSIRARIAGGPGAVRTRVSISIENYTTAEEARALLQAAGRGGRDAVVASLRNLNKGLVSVTGAEEWRVNAARVYPTGAGRKIVIVWDRAAIRGASPVVSQAREYPFGVVELELDNKGTGVGRLIETAAVRLDDHGFVEVERYLTSAQLLVEVEMEQ